jgi:hypothetical protein
MQVMYTHSSTGLHPRLVHVWRCAVACLLVACLPIEAIRYVHMRTMHVFIRIAQCIRSLFWS